MYINIGSDDRIRRMIYLTGHGGDSYLQVQAMDFISSLELGKYYKEMYIKYPNMKIFTILDTCQASTMFERIDNEIPMVWLASSIRGESSFSHNPNHFISVSTVDKFTFCLHGFLNSVLQSALTIKTKVAVSILSFNQMLRFFQRNLPDEEIAYKINNVLGTNEKKLYLGEYIFNYRTIYFNSYKFPYDENKIKDDGEIFINYDYNYKEELDVTRLYEMMYLNGIYDKSILELNKNKF